MHKLTKLNLTQLISLVIILLGLFGLIQPFYYHVKAKAAQHLLEHAWQKTLQVNEQNFKPWPWADTWPVLKLEFNLLQSRKKESLLVLADANGESLAFGPGHLTPRIIPGSLGNAIIAAHRDTHFANLHQFNLGDEIKVKLRDLSEIKFIIDMIEVVDARVSKPIETWEEARLTLVTCYPFDGINDSTPFRYIVSGVRI